MNTFSRFATFVAHATGHPITFSVAVALLTIWALSGPHFGYSEQWQLVVNTGTTIVTCLMVLLIQNTQNRDSKAIHAKLDELVRAVTGARDDMAHVEDLSEQEIDEKRQ